MQHQFKFKTNITVLIQAASIKESQVKAYTAAPKNLIQVVFYGIIGSRGSLRAKPYSSGSPGASTKSGLMAAPIKESLRPMVAS